MRRQQDERDEIAQARRAALAALGDGSDYHGVPGLRRRLRAEPWLRRRRRRGAYHSIYDDFYWYTHFVDKDFVYGRALAQTARHRRHAPGGRRPHPGRIHGPRRDAIAKYEPDLEKLLKEKQDEFTERNTELARRVCSRRPRSAPAAAAPTRRTGASRSRRRSSDIANRRPRRRTPRSRWRFPRSP